MERKNNDHSNNTYLLLSTNFISAGHFLFLFPLLLITNLALDLNHVFTGEKIKIRNGNVLHIIE